MLFSLLLVPYKHYGSGEILNMLYAW